MLKHMFITILIFGVIILSFAVLGSLNVAVGDELRGILETVKDAWDTFTGLGEALSNAEREFNKIGK